MNSRKSPPTHARITRSPIKRAGSKGRLMKHILPHIAAAPHACFVEPFCGSCSVLMAKPRSKVEVVNDKDGELVNTLRQVRTHPEEVARQLQLVPNSREEFAQRRKQPGVTEIQRAATYLYLNNLSFGADGKSFGVVRKSGGGASTPLSRVLLQMSDLSARLDGVIIEQLDWSRCAELYDSPETLFFFDPPYVGGKVAAYAAWSNEDVQSFRKGLNRLKGRWIVTLNDSPEVRAVFSDCTISAFDRPRGIANNSGASKRYSEVVITSPAS